MTDSYHYIDDYFNGKMTPSEKEEFEKRCETDPAFAEDVAFMIALEDAAKHQLYKQKKEQFDELYKELSGQKQKRIGLLKMLVPYMAAACLIVAVALFFIFKPPSPQTLADGYIKSNINTLSVTMGIRDSLQMGIVAYNKKNYVEAERIFRILNNKPDVSRKAVENLGIVYLVTGRYDEALEQFRTLSQLERPDNRGPFYTALVLMKRDQGDDEANAKKLLLEVIKKNLPGRREAEIWVTEL